MVKLIIQIPCYNEEKTILATLNDIPKSIPGIDVIEVLIIDDGSTDNSSVLAKKWGANVLELSHNKGLANAFRCGIQECLRRGADIIVNTDADNQYCAGDIKNIVEPILKGDADIVIGARDVLNIKSFSPLKKILQKTGSAVL